MRKNVQFKIFHSFDEVFFSKDMKDLLKIFERHCVKYVLVGGYVVNYYGYIRTSQDIDLLIFPSPENARKVMAALVEFGFGDAGIPIECLSREGCAIHMGVEPDRIDILTCVKGVKNDKIFADMENIQLEGIPVNIISYSDLNRSKTLFRPSRGPCRCR